MENNQPIADHTKTTLLRRRDQESLTDYVLRWLQAYPVRHTEQSFYRPAKRVKPGTSFEKFIETR